jgi:anti-sigma regulatory factor (Ser/Thr protein kinase)
MTADVDLEAPAIARERDGREGDAAGAARQLLARERDRAERLLNGVRAGVLLLLAIAALVYAPSLTPALNRANMLLLAPTLAWTLAQYLLFYRRPTLPSWLSIVNPVVDITAVTAIMASYGLAQSAALALKSPIFLVYFAILAARPIASSTLKAAAVASLTVLEYAALIAAFWLAGRLPVAESPVSAILGAGISPLDEGAKLLLLGVAGAIATYATAWHERLAIRYYRESRDRERLETRLVQAQLQSLRLQLHPHFLFNTLNSINTLITEEPLAAERMVSGLSEFLRLSLRNAGEQEVPLEREIDLLRHYIDIQRVRFEDRLTVELVVAPETRAALVPNLLLQPLVENAIRHGIAPRSAPGRIEIRAERQDAQLKLLVADDGVGLPGAADVPAREGTGLGNTRARLRHLYGTAQRFHAGRGAAGGFSVQIAIPFRTAAERTGPREDR